MGSTGSKISSVTGKTPEDLGVRNASFFDGNVRGDNDFDKHTSQDIQLKIHQNEGKDIIFQFKLLQNGKMSIRAYDPNVPEKGKVSVTVSAPSLTSVIQNGSAKDKQNAMIIRDLMSKSKSGITESSLGKIANELIMRKKNG